MAYTLDFSLALGTSKTGLTDLRAQFVDTAGASVGLAVSTGFVEIGQGNYLWHATAVPSGHQGGVKFYSAADSATILAFSAINSSDSLTVTPTGGIAVVEQVNACIDIASPVKVESNDTGGCYYGIDATVNGVVVYLINFGGESFRSTEFDPVVRIDYDDGAWTATAIVEGEPTTASNSTLLGEYAGFMEFSAAPHRPGVDARKWNDGTLPTVPTAAANAEAARASIERTGGVLAGVATKANLITAGQVTIESPLSGDGLHLTLVRGDTYSATIGRAIEFTDESLAWPDLTGATITFTVRRKRTPEDVQITATGTASRASEADPWVVSLDLTAAATAAMAVGSKSHVFDLRATLDDDDASVITLCRGECTVIEDQTRA
jgi:hypothetical protein